MFSNRHVRIILMSRVLLQLGIWVRNFAVLLYVTEWTNNDPVSVSLISVAEFAPIFLFAVIGGIFADKWRPKTTMVWSDLLSAVSVAAVLLALAGNGWIALLVGSFVSASLSQFSQPSAMKLFKKHVAEEQLQPVMAMMQSIVGIFTVLGPGIGTFIFIQFGITVSLVLTMVLFLGSAGILLFLPKEAEELESSTESGFWNELIVGFRYISSNLSLRTLSMTFAVSGLAVGLIQPMLLFIVIEQLGQEKTFLQWMVMVNGAAMLAGGAVIMSAAKKVKPQQLIGLGLLVSAVCTIGIGSSPFIGLTFLFQGISGLFYPCIQVGIQTMIIRNTEGAFIGRVSGAITPVFMGMMVVGMWLAGYVKGLFSLFAVYTLSGILLIAGALLLTPLLTAGRGLAKKEASS